MTTLHSRKSIDPSPLRTGFVLFTLIAALVLVPTIQAVTPAPDGGYPNGNTAEGNFALFSLTTGVNNTAIGFQALFSNTNGGFNTASGYGALLNNSTGGANTASGASALETNTTGSLNTASGSSALLSNTTGSFNTANGFEALASNTTGFWNTANGVFALDANTTGRSNVANGFQALQTNTTGSSNTANGAGNSSFPLTGALANNTSGNRNTATGSQALSRNQTGNGNTAEGFQALANNSGSFNVAVGFAAGFNLTTGRDNIDIGAQGVAGESNTIRIGTVHQTATFITGIRGVTTGMANAIPVLIDSAGQLGTMSSSRRFKNEIQPMDKASEAILALKPVTFHYKSDKTGTPQFGLIAEEVAAVNADLVVRDKDGEIYTVRYDQVNAMLLNEFLKEHSTVQELKKEIAALAATVKEQASQIQRVSAQLETNKPAPQVVNNP